MCRLWAERSLRKTAVMGFALLCYGFCVSCGPSHSARQAESATGASTANKETDTKRYELTGRVVSIDKPAHSISVDGDEIPGFMAAMTMPYQVKDIGVLDKLSPGVQIKAEIVMGNDGVYLENIVPAQKASSPKPTK